MHSRRAITKAISQMRMLWTYMQGLEFRHPSEVDLEIITDILNLSRRGLPFQRSMTPEEIGSETFLDSDCDPGSAWLVFEDGLPMAYGEAFVDRQRVAFGRTDASGRVEVVPEARGRGIEQELLRRISNLTRSKGLEAVQLWSSERDLWKASLLVQSGFRDVHHYFSMVWKGNSLPMKASWPEGTTYRHRMFKEANSGELRDALLLSNEAFSELFNYSPWPLERLVNFKDTVEDSVAPDLCVLRGKTGRGVLVRGQRPVQPRAWSEGRMDRRPRSIQALSKKGAWQGAHSGRDGLAPWARPESHTPRRRCGEQGRPWTL